LGVRWKGDDERKLRGLDKEIAAHFNKKKEKYNDTDEKGNLPSGRTRQTRSTKGKGANRDMQLRQKTVKAIREEIGHRKSVGKRFHGTLKRTQGKKTVPNCGETTKRHAAYGKKKRAGQNSLLKGKKSSGWEYRDVGGVLRMEATSEKTWDCWGKKKGEHEKRSRAKGKANK